MKLISCYVRSFGKLKELKYDFKEGVNPVYGDNGWGKTTLGVFLLSMFYGLNDTAKKNIGENERKKYFTWNSTEKIGGYVEFERDNKRYRIERYFGSKSAMDSAVLTDLETGKTFGAENLGQRLFKVDKEGFRSTAFFSQNDLEVKNNYSVTGILASGANEEASAVQKAVDKLGVAAKKYKHLTGSGGEIPALSREIYICQEEIDKTAAAQKAYIELKDSLKSVSEEYKEKSELLKRKRSQKEEYDRSESVVVKRRFYEQTQSKIKKLENDKSEVLLKTGGKTISEQSADDFNECVKEYLRLKKDYGDKKLAEKERESSKKIFDSNRRGIFFALASLSVIFLIAGLITLFLKITVAGICGLSAFLIFAVAAAIALKKQSSESERKICDEREISESGAMIAEYEKKLSEFLSVFKLENSDFVGAAVELKSLARESERINAELISENKKLLEYEQTNDVEVKEYSEGYIDKLNAEILSLSVDCDRLQEKKSKDAQILISYEEKVSKLPELENQLALLNEELAAKKERYEIIMHTAKFLQLADDVLKTKYRQPLEENLNKYFSLISENDDKRLSVDVDLKVKIEEKGLLSDKEYFSEGYKDLANVCERFALVDLVFEGEKPFIVLDDPFVNLDGEKLQKAVTYVQKLAKDFQIIYFYCHESRSIE